MKEWEMGLRYSILEIPARHPSGMVSWIHDLGAQGKGPGWT